MSKFVISKAKNGVMFNLVASNGEKVATSEVYTTKTACKKGIASVQKNAGVSIENQTEKDFKVLKGAKFEIYKDKRGEYRFRMKAMNAKIIATSQGYSSMQACMNGIKSIKTSAKSATIVDETLVRAPAKSATKLTAKKPATKSVVKKACVKKACAKK